MKGLVLCSGGIRSSFLAVEAAKEGEALLLFLDCGQLNRIKEEESVLLIADHFNIPRKKIVVNGFPPVEEPLLRFLCYFCYALPIAREFECNIIYHGLSRNDLPITAEPDTVEEFLRALQGLLSMSLPRYDGEGQWLGDLDIETPLRRLMTQHVIRLGNEWLIPWEFTWSCSISETVHCGRCTKCQQRKEAFEKEGSEDPTIYGK